MRKAKTIIACMAALAVLVTVQSAAAQGKLQGVWKVTETTLTGPNARTTKPAETDILIFTKKYLSAVVVTAEKPRPALPQKDATDAQKLATWEPFLAATGTYEVKGTTFTFHPIAAKNPVEPGEFITFDFKIEGNTLSLTLKANKAGPIANPMTIKMVRLE